MCNEFNENNLRQWRESISEIFPNTIPEEATWTNREEIVEILNRIAVINLNHTFCPEGGGFDLSNVELLVDNNYISLYDGSRERVIKPSKLVFNSFENDESFNCSYFRLETYNSENDRSVCKGPFVIFAKASRYNRLQVPDPYSGIHSSCNSVQFREFIQKVINL